MSCTCVLHDYISNCLEVIHVNANLIGATDYKWIVTDKFGNKYEGTSTTDVEGNFDLQVSDLRDGFLTPFSGVFLLEVFDEDDVKQDFEIDFYVKGGDFVKDKIGSEP